MRRLAIFSALLGASLLTACSFSSDFIVINDSQQPIEVSYRFRFAGQIKTPATVARAEVGSKRPEYWQELNGDRYKVDQVWRTVRLRLMPAEALRLATMHNYSSHESGSSGSFPIDELTVRGANGEIVLRGDQVRLSFSKEGTQDFVLTYK
jgi:hypothetical protein